MDAFSLPIQPRTNPYLDEIDAAAQGAHAQLSPGAQEALKRAGAPIPGQAAQPTQRISSPPATPIKGIAQEPMSEKLPNGEDAMLAGTGIRTPRPAPAMPLPGGTRGTAATNFNTTLSPGEEPQFQSWKSEFAPKDSGEDYDLRGAYKYGLTPSPENGHWSDRFKKPNEPTFSNESQYAQDAPEKAGHWNGDTYVPPQQKIASPARAPITPVPLSPEGQAAQGEANRITAPDTGQHNKQNTGVSGINQIHSPWARIPLQIAEAIGTGFAPRLTSAIPGTQLHHNVLMNQAEGAVTQQQKQRADEEAAQTAAVKATQEQAQGHLQEATAEDIEREGKLPSGRQYVKVGKDGLYDALHKVWVREPTDAEEGGKIEQDENGHFVIIHPSGKVTVATDEKGQPVKGQAKEGREGELPLGDRVEQLNQALTSRYQVLHPKSPLPAQYQIPANATQKDYERIDKALESEERAVGTREQQAQTNEMRRQTMALAAGNAQNRQDTAIRSAGFKAYTPALDSAERFNVMAKNYEDAVKNHDQQAMLSLLANHLGMTMGLQKGSRLTRDIIREAETSRPWLQGMAAKFDKDGYLSGVNLTPTQMRQMVDLGRERFSEDVTKAHSEAAYQGVQDQGPARIPNKSTINHYTALANGDPKKAKELAAADGWTVQ